MLQQRTELWDQNQNNTPKLKEPKKSAGLKLNNIKDFAVFERALIMIFSSKFIIMFCDRQSSDVL